MATFDEVLSSVELEQEQIDKIKNAMKEAGIFTASQENLDVRYGKLKDQNAGVQKELDAARETIKKIEESKKDDEDLQGQIEDYKKQVEDLEREKVELEKNNALQVALLGADVKDVDYLSFKVKEKGEIELDENGKIKGIDDTLEELKNQHPDMFNEKATKKVDVLKLNKGEEEDKKMSKDDLRKKDYAELKKLKDESPEAFSSLKEGVSNGNNN